MDALIIVLIGASAVFFLALGIVIRKDSDD